MCLGVFRCADFFGRVDKTASGGERRTQGGGGKGVWVRGGGGVCVGAEGAGGGVVLGFAGWGLVHGITFVLRVLWL